MIKKMFYAAEVAVFLSVSLVIFAAIFIAFPSMRSEAWAAWVQAFGSIGAILVAVWVSADQQRKQKLRDQRQEQDEVHNMLRSIRDEMYVTYDSTQIRSGPLFKASEPGTAIKVRLPLAEKPFPIYESCLDKFGRIPDDNIRKLIIEAHGHARGFVLSVRYNNGLVDKYEHADYMARAMNDGVHHIQFELIERQLCLYGDTLRDLYKETCERIESMINSLDQYLDKSNTVGP